MLKKILPLTLLFLSCGIDFPTRYDRIDNDRVRFPAFVYDNNGLAEGAPGDTVVLHAYFAGEPMETTEWTVSTTVLMGSFGSDTSIDTVSLHNSIIPGTYKEYTGGLTDSVVFSFVLPRDLIRKKFENAGSIGSMIPPSMHDSLPSGLLEMKPIDLINVLELLAYAPGEVDSLSLDSLLQFLTGDSSESTVRMFPVILQALSVTMRVFSVVNGEYKVASDFTIRYNGRLRYLGSSIPVNRNPEIAWIRLYKIRGEKSTFDFNRDKSLIETVYEMGGDEDTIQIEDDFSYFFLADSGISSIDSGMSMTSGSLSPETFNYEWFFRNDDIVPGQKSDNLLVLQSIPGFASVKMHPPIDQKMQHFTIWLVVYDSFLGERLRPVGFWFRAVHGVFKY